MCRELNETLNFLLVVPDQSNINSRSNRNPQRFQINSQPQSVEHRLLRTNGTQNKYSFFFFFTLGVYLLHESYFVGISSRTGFYNIKSRINRVEIKIFENQCLIHSVEMLIFEYSIQNRCRKVAFNLDYTLFSSNGSSWNVGLDSVRGCGGEG